MTLLEIPLYQVDAFTDTVFGGNPAAVCPLLEWLPEQTMQAIAAENNLSETAFFIARADTREADYDLRWFTPAGEVDLCGHATLATAHVVLTRLKPDADTVRFQTRSGVLEVSCQGDRLAMDFPSRPPMPRDGLDGLGAALGAEPAEVLAARDGFAVFEDADSVAALAPDMAKVAALDVMGVIATAPGQDCDFVSRFFAPGMGIPEDPVTGSAHCTLIPYWAGRLGKKEMFARQISSRGGEIWCTAQGDRVKIAGRAVFYMEGIVTL